MKKFILKKFENFAKNLKLERLSQHLTQKQLAEKINIAHQSYQAYEAGISLPTLENLLKLCYVLNTSLNDLFDM